MKISDVEKVTGLTSKAIRLYEEKGLISVERKDNSYREYTDDIINRLKQIKLLRDLGISISELSLYFNNVITLQELISKRKDELENESIANKENYYKCLNLLEGLSSEENNSNVIVINRCKSVLGLDIGTTTISAVVIDIEKNSVLETYTVANSSKLESDSDLFEYDVNWITQKCNRIIEYLTKAYPNVLSIGITGQMHGVIYVDENGKAVSPLYNWQDGRGNRKKDNKTYCEIIYNLTGYKVFSGYGFSTLYYNKVNGLEPQNANSFCTVMDYIAMNLSGVSLPIIHPTNAASLGLFNLDKNEFDADAINKLGLSNLNLPKIANIGEIAGYYNGIPVGVAIGDNQASFYGSVKNEETTALVNFGTGSQISVVVDKAISESNDLELRPYLFGNYLLCGCALCGGKAYSVLEKFFSSYAKIINEKSGSQYEIMNSLAQKAYEKKSALKVSTKFSGTRTNPDLRGNISGIDDNNFTPENLILGVLQGMSDELKEFYNSMNVTNITELVASGNAVQKNVVLQLLLKDTFGLGINLTNNCEEAALGAALFAGVSAKTITKEQLSNIITYKTEH